MHLDDEVLQEGSVILAAEILGNSDLFMPQKVEG
jgi:hypothetical protein